MAYFNHYKLTLTIGMLLSMMGCYAQISPGALSQAHAHLEGIRNCTQCHTVGHEVTREKCLACHKEINSEIKAEKGLHASKEAMSKNCTVCHNEHHGRSFDLKRFNTKIFDHQTTGFALSGAHAKQTCTACHKADFIQDPVLKKRKGTFMGLNNNCLSCHKDYHQGQLSTNCSNCHNFNSFKNATGFSHQHTQFPLLGKHQNVKCVACHKMEIINGQKTQRFKGLKFDNCNACHRDAHQGRFGQDCKRCHTEESFHILKNPSAFDHNKTNFPLLGLHQKVACKSCHTSGKLTDPIPHATCTSCHKDFHHGEFQNRDGSVKDCSQCHTNNGFNPSTFTIEQHNKHFELKGAHLATDCMACHKKENKWTFKNIDQSCTNCHENVHKGFFDSRFSKKNCTTCHNENNWHQVSFDHNSTSFPLDGKHARLACEVCHYPKNEKGVRTQIFRGLSPSCESCHKEPHAGQFAENGATDCRRCHNTQKWDGNSFDHSKSRFKLDGAHENVDCDECHHTVKGEKGEYVQYKFKDISCASCHK